MKKQHAITHVMTKNPQTIPPDASVAEAARIMQEADFGCLVVTKADGSLCGIVTDRDIVIRCVAKKQDLETTPVDSICSHDTVSLSPEDTLDEAIAVMARKHVRRIPVVKDGRPVGIVSLGDLAIARQPNSALGSISRAPAQS